MRKTKIVATIGPASQDIESLTELIKNGLDVARLNFSHGNHEEHLDRINNIREAEKLAGKKIAIMLDTKGPEIRTGEFKEKVLLEKGNKVIITKDDIVGDSSRFTVSYKEIVEDIEIGAHILIDDGLIDLLVEGKNDKEIVCKIMNTGEVSSNKGVNLPNIDVNLPSLTEKDISDILFGIEHNLDFIAASFVRSSKDVLEILKILEDNNSDIRIVSKIENHQGVANIDEIMQLSHGVMVARGDLGVEIPAEEVPLVQKMIIEKANSLGKPVITATQMLDSMIRNPRPTRAEASDVANAILDGTDAVMLSGETAAGKYPLESLKTMARIALRAEEALDYSGITEKRASAIKTTPDSISHATCEIAEDLNAKAIITSTTSGSTARMVSKYRPASKIIAATPDESVYRKLNLVWGVKPVITDFNHGTDEMVKDAIEKSLDEGLIENGDLIVLTAGVPVGLKGTTNLIKVEVVGKILSKGVGIGHGQVQGSAKILKTPENLESILSEIREDDILITYSTDIEFIPVMEKVKGFVTEAGGFTSHAAIAGLSMKKPVIVGACDAIETIEDGEDVTLDLTRGIIYRGHISAV